MSKFRINGFDQIKAFYSSVFNNEHEFTPQHISLYVFLINQNNRNNWVEWFKCPFDLGMAGSCIGSKKTYYKCLDDLMEWGFIKYEKGINEWKSPKIKIEVLKCTATNTTSDTATETADVPLSEPLPIPLGVIDINKETNKQETDNILISDELFLTVKKDFENSFTQIMYIAKKNNCDESEVKESIEAFVIDLASQNKLSDPFKKQSEYFSKWFTYRKEKQKNGFTKNDPGAAERRFMESLERGE